MHSSECLFFEIRWRGIWWMHNSRLRASSHEPGWPDRPGCRGQSVTLYSYQKSQPGFRNEKGQKSWRLLLARNWRNEANMMNIKIIIALPTFKAVSLHLNGMLVKWKYCRQCETMPSGLPEFIRLSVPVTGLKCSYAKISSPPSHMIMNTSKIFTKDLEVRWDPGTLVSPVNLAQLGSCERPFIRWYHDE